MKKLIVCLLFVGVLFSCEDSDDGTPKLSELDGQWELQGVSCFCFYPEDFDFSVHKVTFDSEDSTVTIENSSETFFISAAGSYDFEVEGNTIVVKNTLEFTYELNGDILILSYIDDPDLADDELSLTYKKIN